MGFNTRYVWSFTHVGFCWRCRFNSMFNQWEHMSAMPEAVLHPAVAATNQRIYVFGGEDAMQNPVRIIQVGSFDQCRCFDPSIGELIHFPSLSPPICLSAGVSHCEEHVV